MINKLTDKRAFNRKDHWEQVYSEKESTEVSWYQQHPQRSLDLIKATGLDFSAAIIDVGGGASKLADFILAAGYINLSVLDISHGAIEHARFRLGDCAEKITWLEQDITEFTSDVLFDIWHDRAVFHFLTEANDQTSYVRAMSRVLKPGANAIIATFDLDGPEKCSGLEVARYSPETMSDVLGDAFQLIETSTEKHITPSGSSQNFVYCRFTRV